MSREYLIEFTERAEVAYQRLPNVARHWIDQILQRIQHTGLRSRHVTKVRGPEKMYLARAGRDLRIIFILEDDILTILDIVSHDKIQRLSRLYDWRRED